MGCGLGLGRCGCLQRDQRLAGVSGLAIVESADAGNQTVKRDVYKFLAGFVASLAYTHAAFAVAASKGIISEPMFLGRKWSVGFMWAEAAIYSVVGMALAQRAWRREDDKTRTGQGEISPANEPAGAVAASPND
mgnify:CR=1 FL=1